MKNRNRYLIIIFLFLTFFQNTTYSIPRKYSLEKKSLYKEYANLSCKIDSLYYALQYFVDNLPSIEWFINKIPAKKEKYFQLNNDGSYSISDPMKTMIGSFWGQQARFSYKGKLFVVYDNKAMPVYYDKNNYLDSKAVYREYGRIISFGIDNELLIDTFKNYLNEKNITYNYFKMNNPSVDDMAMLFAELIYSDKIIVCNAIAGGLKNPRTFDFKVIETNKIYRWKEASHSFVLIGYDFDKKLFIAADNYGNINNPYVPAFREISFEELYKEVTLIDKNNFDKSFYLMKK